MEKIIEEKDKQIRLLQLQVTKTRGAQTRGMNDRDETDDQKEVQEELEIQSEMWRQTPEDARRAQQKIVDAQKG